MSESKLHAYAKEAAPVIESALANLVHKDLSIETGSIAKTDREAVLQNAASYFTVVSKPVEAPAFALQFAPDWIHLISDAILGTAMTADDPGVVDLTSQLTSQALTAWKQQTETGSGFPDTTLDAFNPGEEIPGAALEESLWSVSFTAEVESEFFEGILYIAESAISPSSARVESPPAAAPTAPTALEDPVDVSHVSFPEFGRETVKAGTAKNFDLLAEVELNVTVELGRRRIPLSEILLLTTGSVIELEKLVGEPLEIFANGRLIAEGEAVVVDEQFGVRITNLASTKNRVKAFA